VQHKIDPFIRLDIVRTMIASWQDLKKKKERQNSVQSDDPYQRNCLPFLIFYQTRHRQNCWLKFFTVHFLKILFQIVHNFYNYGVCEVIQRKKDEHVIKLNNKLINNANKMHLNRSKQKLINCNLFFEEKYRLQLFTTTKKKYLTTVVD
jgi:hypothetical protein